MIEAVVLVPIRDNDRLDFERRDWDALEERLIPFGGFSLQPNVMGAWRAPNGQIHRDVSNQYTVALPSWTDIAAWLDIVRWAKERFRQEAMYIRVAGIAEVLE
ncbi:MAG: hypothetical protein NTZ05_19190 [Chloroflexi bacterium]|nr:hypothetical protein [Chloroflexota bacterium]